MKPIDDLRSHSETKIDQNNKKSKKDLNCNEIESKTNK